MNKWGCHSKPHLEGYMVKDGYLIKGGIMVQLMRYQKDTSSRECQYRKERPDDPGCEGCTCP